MTTRPLPRSTSAAQGVDAGGVLQFLDGVRDAGIELHSLMLLRHGYVVAEGWWRPYTADGVQLVYSLSKSFTSTALGFAVAEGLVSLDDRAIDLCPEVTGPVSQRSASITLHHLASMNTGHSTDTLDAFWRLATGPSPRTFEQEFFAIEPDHEPGCLFCYHNGATFLLALILQRLSGQTLIDYLTPRLLRPLGARRVGWQTDPFGRQLGFSGIHVATETIAALGQTYLADGALGGRRVLPPGWVRLASQRHTDNFAGTEASDWEQGYGYQFWLARHGYRGDGAYGQFCVILPEQGAVLALTACTENMQGVLDLAWQHLLPAFRSDADPAREAELAERLAGLELTPVAGAGGVPTGPLTFTAEPGAFEDLVDVTVTPEGDAHRLDLRFVDAAPATVVVGDGRWVPGMLPGLGVPDVVVQASGGWSGDTFTAHLIVATSPHRLVLTARDASVASTWLLPPLGAQDPRRLGVQVVDLDTD